MVRFLSVLTVLAGLALLGGAVILRMAPESMRTIASGIGVDPFDLVMDPMVPAQADPPHPPAQFIETRTATLTGYTRTDSYTPTPGQGTLHRSEAALVWWGWAPPGDTARPAILLLHGAGRGGDSMIDMWRETAERQNLVLVAPNLGTLPEWDFGLPDPRALMIALDEAAEIYPIDRSRVAMFGHSRGAIAAQVIANRYDGPWRAVAVHGGTVPMSYVRPAAASVPIRHYLGSLDTSFPFGPARQAGESLAAAGHPYELVRLDGHSHWFYDAGEEIAAHAWGWMQTQID